MPEAHRATAERHSGVRNGTQGSGYTLRMGLTIHFQGQLGSEADYEAFVAAVAAYAGEQGWAMHGVAEGRRELVRVLQPEDPDADEVEEVYMGRVRGVILLPDALCEPLAFEFGDDLFMQDWCKTQFAGAAVHAAIVRLFREVEPLFGMLDVMDEAGFWEAGESPETHAELGRTFAETRGAIEAAAAESPGASVAVVTPSGDTVTLIRLAQGMQEATHTTTDSKGHYSLDVPDEGIHLVRVTHEGAFGAGCRALGDGNRGVPEVCLRRV